MYGDSTFTTALWKAGCKQLNSGVMRTRPGRSPHELLELGSKAEHRGGRGFSSSMLVHCAIPVDVSSKTIVSVAVFWLVAVFYMLMMHCAVPG